MYIWILLATIMVALSFFNLSPRADKEHALNEIRAATVVNRFKAEHVAMQKTMQCEIVKNRNNGWDNYTGNTSDCEQVIEMPDPSVEPGMDMETQQNVYATNRQSACGPVEVKHDIDLGYLSFADNLPVGYEENSSIVQSYHYIYCLDRPVENSTKPRYIPCNKVNTVSTNYTRYMVSFARIPDRWIAHDNAAGEQPTPVPMFATFLAKSTSSGSIYGWTDCKNGKCVLRGMSNKAGSMYYKDENFERTTKNEEGEDVTTTHSYKKQFFEYTILPDNAIFWDNKKFKEVCIESKYPCLLVYEKMAVSDPGKHCAHLMGIGNEEENTEEENTEENTEAGSGS